MYSISNVRKCTQKIRMEIELVEMENEKCVSFLSTVQRNFSISREIWRGEIRDCILNHWPQYYI